MFERLDTTRSLTANQRRIVVAAILGDMLEFFDYFLIGFVLAFIVGPWQLSFGQSAIILLSSGIGAILGAVIWGRLADRIGRRAVFIGTVLNFSLATGILALTPDHGWIFLTIFRFFVGFGVGGLYCVDLPLVQEFVPASRRSFIGGLVTAFIPIGVMIGSILGAFLAPVIGWRGLFACGLVPAALTLLIRAWVPESPRWLVRMGRPEEARRSLGRFRFRQPRCHCRSSMKLQRDRQPGASYFVIREAYSCLGSAISACRRRAMGSFSGHGRCSSCCSACRRPRLPICSYL